MDTEQKRNARKTRENYLRNRPLLELDVAHIVDAITGDPDGLMPVAKLGEAIQLELSNWMDTIPPPGRSYGLRLWWRAEGELDPVLLHEEILSAPVQFPVKEQILEAHFRGREGRFTFWYSVRNWNDTQFTDAPQQFITLDRTPIWGQDDPPAVEDPGPVNEAVLAADGGVWLTVPAFEEAKKDSVRVSLVWTNTVPDPDQPISPSIVELLPEQTRRVLMPRNVIDALGSGDHYVAYELYDKAGNRSRVSRVRPVQVVLGPVPENLKPPFVPLAPGGADTLIDLEDANLGVTVEIAEYTGHQPNDYIVVQWGVGELPAQRVGGGNPLLVSVPVPWDHLDTEYTDDPLDQVTPVTYTILRGSAPFPLPTADAIKVDVNFAYTGPENPDEPDPVNPALDLVVVKGDSGQENHLVPGDANLPATASFTLYDPVTAGDVITLFWKGVAVQHVITLVGSETPGTPMTFDVQWDEIEGGGTGVVEVHYSLSNPAYPNDVRSRPTAVTVHAIPVLLDKPEFPDIVDVGGLPILNCSALRRRSSDGAIGYRVQVPPSAYLVAGEQISLRWVLYEYGTSTEVSGTELLEDLTIAAGAEVVGVEWFVTPYDLHILPAREDTTEGYATGHLAYTLTINAAPVISEAAEELVSPEQLGTPDGTCDLGVVPGMP
ncbi:hypothetical protein NJC40_09245 [Pseudomonas sp. 21LCFQ02]|uniref:hypothetical protein n=1 Tax=Pseudomonas sp. 21LCFQ02 TaxID=2957505 RepID=UPI00209A7BB4|nr:hypothetical protein [Pseudomonas sp. 21LCFQ02]MCO8167958.1 hypothetical protein [Pseudomonas sp. 21LCFQ02]